MISEYITAVYKDRKVECLKLGRLYLCSDTLTATHISLAALSCGLPKDSVILLEQIRTLDKRRLREHMGKLDETMMKQVDGAIAVSFVRIIYWEFISEFWR